ncbi:hypothetical protein BGZ89_009694 [Linnemannia elongata]|nr:hypothetical protein BGZ89_009694 [Linnemannia elongata]
MAIWDQTSASLRLAALEYQLISPNHKPASPSDYDKYISGELPDPDTHPAAYETVKNAMIHDSCGEANRESPL